MNVQSVPGCSLVLTDITLVNISDVLGLDVSLDSGGVCGVVVTLPTQVQKIMKKQLLRVSCEKESS